jgi:hypothetical protein
MGVLFLYKKVFGCAKILLIAILIMAGLVGRSIVGKPVMLQVSEHIAKAFIIPWHKSFAGPNGVARINPEVFSLQTEQNKKREMICQNA